MFTCVLCYVRRRHILEVIMQLLTCDSINLYEIVIAKPINIIIF